MHGFKSRRVGKAGGVVAAAHGKCGSNRKEAGDIFTDIRDEIVHTAKELTKELVEPVKELVELVKELYIEAEPWEYVRETISHRNTPRTYSHRRMKRRHSVRMHTCATGM